jgi:hypothetical protein
MFSSAEITGCRTISDESTTIYFKNNEEENMDIILKMEKRREFQQLCSALKTQEAVRKGLLGKANSDEEREFLNVVYGPQYKATLEAHKRWEVFNRKDQSSSILRGKVGTDLLPLEGTVKEQRKQSYSIF